MTIAIVTDSTAQVSAELARSLDVTVVPITITLDGVDHLEGVDLGAREFHDRYVEGETEVTTAAPTPGVIADTYEALIAAGAEAIVSVHVGRDHSATVDAATTAASLVDVPVHVVDTGLASFGVFLSVWAAVDARDAGADASTCADAARAVLPRIGSVFVLDAGVLPGRSGRFDTLELPAADTDGVPVYFYGGGEFAEVGRAGDDAAAVELMVERILTGGATRVASGRAGAVTLPLADALEAALAERDVAVVTYEVGPSVAAHTGPRTAGAFFLADPTN